MVALEDVVEDVLVALEVEGLEGVVEDVLLALEVEGLDVVAATLEFASTLNHCSYCQRYSSSKCVF